MKRNPYFVHTLLRTYFGCSARHPELKRDGQGAVASFVGQLGREEGIAAGLDRGKK
jgi:hypothetical protein